MSVRSELNIMPVSINQSAPEKLVLSYLFSQLKSK